MKWVSKKEKFSKSATKWDLGYFCEIGLILRLRRNLELSETVFAELKLDLESFCLKKQKKERELDLK